MCSDLTAKLSDEILCHVFSYLTLKEKLQSEAVNVKFQQCIIAELKAQPVVLKILSERNLNGFRMMPHQLLEALVTFAKKAKFSTIEVVNHTIGETARMQWLDKLLSLLISECQCLTKLKTFIINSGCSQLILENFLGKCDKLSIVKFDFNARRIAIPVLFNNEFSLELAPLFKNRGMTELYLRPYRSHERGVIQLFTEMKPSTLKKVELLLHRLPPSFNIIQLVNAITTNARFTLTELNLDFNVHVLLADFFNALTRLNVLRHSTIVCYLQGSLNQQFVSDVTSLFKLSHVNITVTVHELGDHIPNLAACEFMNFIRQIQLVHPQLAVDFDLHGLRLVLSLGNARISKNCVDGGVQIPRCQAETCPLCKSFYPALLLFVRSQAHSASVNAALEAQQFLDWRVDRCRVDQLLENLRTWSNFYNPVSAQTSEDQQVVTIRFQAQISDLHFFTITLSCAQCIGHGCMKCR